MWRAIIAGIFSALLLGSLGVFATTRKMSFMGDGVAHASLAGIALAILLGWAPMFVAIIFAIFIAILIYILEKKSNLSADMAISIIFTGGMALGILFLSYYQGYQPELISYLFGNILTISNEDLFTVITVSLIILTLLIIFYRRILFSTFDPVGAYLSGLRVFLYDIFLYIAIAIAVIVSIKLVGIVLVSALLVLPSAISKIFSKSFKKLIILASILSIIIVLSGLLISYYLNLPSGSAIVLVGILFFILASLFKVIKTSLNRKNN